MPNFSVNHGINLSKKYDLKKRGIKNFLQKYFNKHLITELIIRDPSFASPVGLLLSAKVCIHDFSKSAKKAYFSNQLKNL